MLSLMDKIGILRSNESKFVFLRKIRGKLIRRPRKKTDTPVIEASGRSDWVGWCELKTAHVNEIAIENTGRVIRDVDADVLAIVEAESRPVLVGMNDYVLKGVSGTPYPHVMIIDGNDSRGIDVGIMTKSDYPIGTIRSHVHDVDDKNRTIFSRDCPEYQVFTPSGNLVWVLPNHFKSKYGNNQKRNDERRLAQATAVRGIYERLRAEGQEHIIILGDLNDVSSSQPLAPLLSTDLLEVSSHPNFTEFEFRANNGNRGIGTYKLGNDSDKIDYLLLSPALYQRVTNGGIFRMGAWPGKRTKRWETYPELKKEHHAASDHHAIFADLDI